MIPGPPALVTIPTRGARRQRLVREQRGDVEQLREACRCGSPQPGRRARRPSRRRPRAAPRCAIWSRALAGRRSAALDDDDRLLAPDPPRDAGEAARIAERLDVEQRDVGRRVAAPSTRAGRCAVMSARLPIEANEETPRLRSAARSISARPSAPLWVTKPTLPGGGVAGRERGVEADAGARVERRRGSSGRPAASRAHGRSRPARAGARRPPRRPRRSPPRSRRAPGLPARRTRARRLRPRPRRNRDHRQVDRPREYRGRWGRRGPTARPRPPG